MMNALGNSKDTKPRGHSSRAVWFLIRLIRLTVFGAVMCFAGATLPAGDAAGKAQTQESICTKTAEAAQRACRFEAEDEALIALARCYNLTDSAARAKCEQDAAAARREHLDLCDEQFGERADLCEELGEAAYDPQIDPAGFVNPLEIGKTVTPNPWYPLVPGTTRIYKGNGATVTFSITRETREILGVTCITVRDVVEKGGETIEDTKDWFAQDLSGNVWYFGEIAQNFEDGELANIDGSWTAGVDGAKPGIIMKAAPRVGDFYRQEFSLGVAEDAAEVLNLRGPASVPAASCNDCLITEDFTPIEPGAVTHKYYKPGVGPILEVKPDTGARVELVEIKTVPAALTIADLFPNFGEQGERVNLTISGSGFTPQSRVSLSGSGVRVFTQYVSGARLNASVLIAENAFTTSRDLIVSNPDGSATKANAFSIRQ